MSYATLNTVRHDIYALMMAQCSAAQGDKRLHEQWRTALVKHCKYLATCEDLPTAGRPKYYFGPPETLLLIETALTGLDRCMDNTLQHIVLYLIMFYTAARPGSIMKTRHYSGFYLRYKDVAIVRTSTADATRFHVQITLCAWKGGHGLHPWSQSFRIAPVRGDNYLLLDLGLFLIVLGLRRGAFRRHADIQSLLQGSERVLEWKDGLQDEPFLCGSTPRGLGVDYTKPMAYPGFRLFLKQLAEKAGLDPMYTTAYCFRRGTASTMNRVLGSELTKNLLHHKQQSDVLHRHYASNAQQVDLTAMALYGEDEVLQGLSLQDAPALMRPVPTDDQNATPELSLKDALIVSSDLRILHMQKAVLEDIMGNGGDINDAAPILGTLLPTDQEWFARLPQDNQEESGFNPLDALHGRVALRCRRLLSDLRGRVRRSQTITSHARGQAPTVDELEMRLSDIELAGPLGRVLDALVQSSSMPEGDAIICSISDAEDPTEEAGSEDGRLRLME
ncbi:hypothetical protein PYCCODRAFT_1471017 [Trametes coccinea BRFM310]|uniref:Uncharacterized protein n=1 Tax=Trametes coccinea (strain BRFM310) TaxID=1353009 RepID=A0A1Y2IBS1_TRAC3|nr:hypothetical protein PYCCODRAFT_1471017 [Trametes coccinea BRFM310]